MALRLVGTVGANRPAIRLFRATVIVLRIGSRLPDAATVLWPAAVLVQPAILLLFGIFLFIDLPLRATEFRFVRLDATDAGLVLGGGLLFRAARTGLIL